MILKYSKFPDIEDNYTEFTQFSNFPDLEEIPVFSTSLSSLFPNSKDFMPYKNKLHQKEQQNTNKKGFNEKNPEFSNFPNFPEPEESFMFSSSLSSWSSLFPNSQDFIAYKNQLSNLKWQNTKKNELNEKEDIFSASLEFKPHTQNVENLPLQDLNTNNHQNSMVHT